MLGPHSPEKLKKGDPRRSGAVQNDLHVSIFLPEMRKAFSKPPAQTPSGVSCWSS